MLFGSNTLLQHQIEWYTVQRLSMETFLDAILKALKATANNEQQKTLAAFLINLNNMDVITKLQELYKYCLINEDFKLTEEIKQEIIKRKVEITKELAEKAFRKKE